MASLIVIVNLNCLEHSKNLISDILRQDRRESVLFIDQASSESGTENFLSKLRLYPDFKVQVNTHNVPLNHIWTETVMQYGAEFDSFIFLNNDIRVAPNFIDHTLKILELDSNVAAVIHPTNHENYRFYTSEISYDILRKPCRQGWAFAIRTADWTNIPTQLNFYCGDDFIFQTLFDNNKEVAVCKSSPIIHLLSQTRKSKHNKVIPNRNPKADIENYKKLGFKHHLTIPHEYSKEAPTFQELLPYEQKRQY